MDVTREIEFEAWHTEQRVMLRVGDAFGTTHPLDCVGYALQRQPVVLREYTGLKDKNGKKIFEGDIVLWGHKQERKIPNIIIWDEKDYAWAAKDGESLYGLIELYDTELIGNVYESPELVP